MEPELSQEPSNVIGYFLEKLKLTYMPQPDLLTQCHFLSGLLFQQQNPCLPVRLMGKLLFPSEPKEQEWPPHPHSKAPHFLT